MSRLAAERYASALWELAEEKGCVEEVAQGLVGVKTSLLKGADIGKRFFDRRTRSAEKKQIVTEHLAPNRHALVGNLLKLLVDKNREGILLGVIVCFFEMMEQKKGILHVAVESAMELDEEQKTRLVEQLAKATGKTVVPTINVVPELIGGMRLTMESRLIDGTVRASLDKLGARLRAAV